MDDCFQKDRERFVTITSGAQGTVYYLEGGREKFVPYRLDPNVLSGRLLLGDSASGSKPWVGSVFGLAIYNRTLTDEEVLKDYKAWTTANIVELRAQGGITALYPLDEKRGESVHNRAGPMPDLVTPKKFQFLRRVLEPYFRFVKSDLLDAAINIVGFVPFGLLVSAYLHQGLPFPRYRMILLTILVGTQQPAHRVFTGVPADQDFVSFRFSQQFARGRIGSGVSWRNPAEALDFAPIPGQFCWMR